MTATVHALGAGANAGLYYVNDPNKEARPRNRDEYYLADGGGVWWSNAESVVKHGAAIDKASFRDLCAGLHPRHGTAMVRSAGEKHRAGWDVTFSAPKSVSLLWAAGGDEQRAAIEDLHGRAVEAALSFVQRQALLDVRLGAGGKRRETPTDIIVGRFKHTTSRAGDPNLHSHCVFLNVAGCSDGRWRTLEPRTMFEWTKTIGAAYRAELSSLLAEKGFSFRSAGRDQIEIDGVDESLIETFSKRSQMIEKMVGDRATASGARKELAALSTRQSKELVPTDTELEARWVEEFGEDRLHLWAQALAKTAERSKEQERGGSRTSDPDAHHGKAGAELAGGPQLDPVPIAGRTPVARSASALLSHQSVINRREVLRQSLIAASREGGGIENVENELEQLQEAGALLTIQNGRSAAWTTQHLMEREEAMIRACRRGDERPFFDKEAVQSALRAASHLSPEQQDAVLGASSPNGVSLIEAGAGTGKTTLASAIKDAADRSGLTVVGLAPTWLAADELSRSIGVPTQAVAKWRYDREGLTRAYRPAGDAMPKLDRNTVLLLDEAGMLGTLDMAAVLTAAAAAGAKVIAFGDRRQLDAVSSGNPLALVADELDQVDTLTAIRRQDVDWQREASIAMSEGKFDAALGAYQSQCRITYAQDQVTALQKTIDQWMMLRAEHGDDVAIVTRSNRDAARLNELARGALREDGTITFDAVTVQAIDRENKTVALSLAIGDRVRFGANLKAIGVRNGTRGTIRSVATTDDPSDPIVRIELENGTSVVERWTDYAPAQIGAATRPLPRMIHAYAGTVYSVQGRTVEAGVYHIGSRTDAREGYVALTRHRKDVRIVVDADRLLREASHDVLDITASDDEKLAALVIEAERFDEKLNVAAFRETIAARARAIEIERGRDVGLTW